MITTGVCHYRDIMGPHMSTNNKEKGATEMSGRISDGVGVRRRRYNMISVMEAFMRKSKSSVSGGFGSDALTRPLFVTLIIVCFFFFIIKQDRHSAPLFKLGSVFQTWPQTHTHTHTHAERHTCCFCSGARLPGGLLRGCSER